MGSLADGERVYGRVVHAGEDAVAEEVHRLAVKVQKAWARCAVPGAEGPDSPAEVAEALVETTGKCAVELMTHLSTVDLVFHGKLQRSRARAPRAAEGLVKSLGHEARWWTNVEDFTAGVRAWTPVTRLTFDGVVAGAGDGFVVVLLQVGED